MNQNEVVDPGPSELAASKGKPSDTVQVRISPEEPTLGSNNNPWPAAFQTALHLHYSDAETPSGKYSERLVLIVAIIIVSTAVIGAFFLSLYVGIVFSILVTLCIFLIVGIPYCCRFFTYRRSNENQELACSENDGVSPKKSSQTLVSEFPGGGGPPTNNKKGNNGMDNI